MEKLSSKKVKKQFILTAIGFSLQLIGSICVIVASVNLHKMVKAKIKEVFEK